MTTLHFGVYDIPYAAPVPKPKKVPIKPRKKPLKRPIQQRLPLGHQQTTFGVAMRLEQKYHVMQRLYDKHKAQIAQILTDEIAGQFINLRANRRTNQALNMSLNLSGAASEITDIIKQGIAQRELDGFPGIPTRAAKLGINHRLKHPYARNNPERPSFIDTSQYHTAITTWID